MRSSSPPPPQLTTLPVDLTLALRALASTFGERTSDYYRHIITEQLSPASWSARELVEAINSGALHAIHDVIVRLAQAERPAPAPTYDPKLHVETVVTTGHGPLRTKDEAKRRQEERRGRDPATGLYFETAAQRKEFHRLNQIVPIPPREYSSEVERFVSPGVAGTWRRGWRDDPRAQVFQPPNGTPPPIRITAAGRYDG